MKLLIGVVLALLCVQTIQASSPRTKDRRYSDCERNLKITTGNIRRFYRLDFEPKHNEAHELLLIIKGICDQLTQALISYDATAPTSSQIDEFFEAFWSMHLKATEAITRLRYYCDVLLQIFNKYILGQKAVCNANFTGTGCEANTNAAYCDLFGFNAALISMAAPAKTHLDKLLALCDVLYKLAYDFVVAKNNDAEKEAKFKIEFLPGFITVHDDAHTEFAGVEGICEILTKAIAERI